MVFSARILPARFVAKLNSSEVYLPTFATIVIFALVATLMSWKMLRDGVIFASHDLHYHLTWLQHFSQQLMEGIPYPRWLAGTNYGYGSPTFVFYPPLIYYLGSFLKLCGLSADQAVIALFWLAVFGAGYGFYVYGQSRWSQPAALIGAVLYMTSPYFAVNLYVRGALPETWGLMSIPIGLWLTDRAIARTRWSIPLTCFFALLTLTHLPSLILYTLAWTCYTLAQLLHHSWKVIARLWITALMGFGLVALYLLPAMLEQDFVSLRHLHATSGGVAANLIGTALKDNAAFLNGYVVPMFLYYVVLFVVIGIIALLRYQKLPLYRKETLLWLTFLGIIIFMVSDWSLLIWQSNFVLRIIQQPWRLLSLFSFGISGLCAVLIDHVNWPTSIQQINKASFLWLIISLVLLGHLSFEYRLSNSAYGIYNPGKAGMATQAGKKTSWNQTIYRYIQTAITDPYSNKLMDAQEYRPFVDQQYRAPWPRTNTPRAVLKASDPALAKSESQGSQGQVTVIQWDSYNRKLLVNVQQPSALLLRTYAYPAWQIRVNGQRYQAETGSQPDMAEDGRIKVQLNPGTYNITMQYGWTTAFFVGVVIRIGTAIALSIWTLQAFQRFRPVEDGQA